VSLSLWERHEIRVTTDRVQEILERDLSEYPLDPTKVAQVKASVMNYLASLRSRVRVRFVDEGPEGIRAGRLTVEFEVAR
jgi:hypothetical protein